MSLRMREIGVAAILCTAVFLFEGPDTSNNHDAEALHYYNTSSGASVVQPVSTESRRIEQHKEASEQDLTIAVEDTDKSPVQLIPVYKNGDSPRIELAPSR